MSVLQKISKFFKKPIFEPYQQEIIEINTGRLRTIGSDPLILLPKLNDDKYYEVRAIIEFTPGTDPFIINNIGTLSLVINQEFKHIRPDFLAGQIKRVLFISNTNTDSISNYGDVWINPGRLNEDVQLTTWNGTDLEGGDGSITIKLEYKIKQFN